MNKMFVCLECGNIFETPQYWEETHGLDYGPYEKWSGCNICGGAYAEAHKCVSCHDWINDDYVIAGDNRYCQNCYREVRLGDE